MVAGADEHDIVRIHGHRRQGNGWGRVPAHGLDDKQCIRRNLGSLRLRKFEMFIAYDDHGSTKNLSVRASV